MQGHPTRRQVIWAAVICSVPKGCCTSWRTEEESGPPKALTASKFFAAEIGWIPFQQRKMQALLASIDKLLSAGANITMIIKNQSIEHADNCAIRNLMYHRAQDCSGELLDAPYYFKEIHQKYPQISFIEPNKIICKEKRCNTTFNDTLLYRDNIRLNDIGSRLIGENLLRMGVKI